MTIDWENNFDKKDLFTLRLKGTTPQFGYISESKRAKFVQFLKTNQFITYLGNFQDLVEIANKSNPGPNIGADRWIGFYSVEHSFKFEEMGPGSPYRAKERVVTEGHRILTDKSHRIMDMGAGPHPHP